MKRSTLAGFPVPTNLESQGRSRKIWELIWSRKVSENQGILLVGKMVCMSELRDCCVVAMDADVAANKELA